MAGRLVHLKKSFGKNAAALETHPARLLLVAAMLHLAVTTVIFVIGRFQLMPSQFDPNGVGEFAHDGRMHQLDALILTSKLRNEGVSAWLSAVAPLHVRIYSLAQAPLSGIIGFNILSVEPMNIVYYLAIIGLVYKLASALFDRRPALLAATIVALWPTLLLHTTQPLRDPLLITLVLAFFLIVTRLVTERFSWKQCLIAGLSGAILLLAIWIVRLAMWDIVRVVVGLSIILLVLQQVIERRLWTSNVVTSLLLIAGVWVIPQGNQLLQFTEKRQEEADSGRALIGEQVVDLSLWDRISVRREKFLSIRDAEDYRAGSDIDTNVHFSSRSEILRYLPRAAAIGMFAPFPNMWFAKGLLVGKTGRLLSGAEMLLTYILATLALIGAWQRRTRLAVWLLASTAILAATALGLIVVNVGSMYRLRYPFWILIVILGSGGAAHVVFRLGTRESQKLASGISGKSDLGRFKSGQD
jgi:hypothetical protein